MATIVKSWDDLKDIFDFEERGKKGKEKKVEVEVETPEKEDEKFVKKNLVKGKVKKLIRGAGETLEDEMDDTDSILDELEGKLGEDEEEEVKEEKLGKWAKRGLKLEREGKSGDRPRGFVVNTVTTIVKPRHGNPFRDKDEEEPDDHAIREAEEEKDMPKDPMERENLRNEIRGLEERLRSRHS